MIWRIAMTEQDGAAPQASLAERLAALFDHLGFARVDIAAQIPSDFSGFLRAFPDRVNRVALVAPPRVEPEVLKPLAGRLLYIAPSGGLLGRTAASALPALPDARVADLPDYDAESWSDLGVERPDIANHLIGHFVPAGGHDGAAREISGQHAGIRYRAFGSGPPLVLMPMAFAPSQWQPLATMLAGRFRVVALSGPRLGMLALLEERALLTDWQHMCAGLFQALNVAPNHSVLEVGCGSGAVARQFCRVSPGSTRLTAVDSSAYALEEARAAADDAGLGQRAVFVEANAETLPFPDDTFDAAFAVTVLEECNAAKALGELARTVRPGGRVGVIVRAIDMEQWWNLPLRDDLRARIARPAPSVAADGVATAALHARAMAAGLAPVRCYTFSVASEGSDGPVVDYPEMYALSRLEGPERSAYLEAKAAAVEQGTFFVTRPHHCFVGEVVRA
jgi:SAM-dependent methyltransferase